ncbi:alpha/beta hydrolase [Dokdonia sp. Hel_I_53]|uniref:alpha/beta hydrolase n=1 Tax=Dokdonia sp. Hel_I_53 TaxID=1566287 RepID=UPI00119B9688|nr:alpha/beta hydrolase [Dokdonia sp. Hel_I_53]TVZ51404.1 alpha/beta hydrolase family protein DUF900 [Dokdonia sp. Hel_I_53]
MNCKSTIYKSLLFNFIIVLLILTFLTGCYSYNRPSKVPINTTELEPSHTTKVFVDMNGDYYPNNWKETIPENELETSLYKAYKDHDKIAELNTFRKRFLSDFKNKLQDKTNIYIFIHGFNTYEEDASIAFNNWKELINYDSDTDEIVEFYWDGLVADGLGRGKIWFNAVGYSQMAGLFGLRPLLNNMDGKKVFLLSHSRGASVVLSAMGDPSWSRTFYSRTNRVLDDRLVNIPPLKSNNNNIAAILLAPAIGNIDFFKQDHKNSSITEISNYRKLNSQLSSIRFTTNASDKILKKWFGPLSLKFNPTSIGHNGCDVPFLKKVYPTIEFIEYDFSKAKHSHGFNSYIRNPKLLDVLADAGILRD